MATTSFDPSRPRTERMPVSHQSLVTQDPRPLLALLGRGRDCHDCFSSLSAIIAVLDPDGRVRYGNAALDAELPDWSPGADEPAHLADVWPVVAAALPDLRTIDDDGQITTHVREAQLSPGEPDPRDHLIYLDPVTPAEGGPLRGWTLTLVDISHIRQAERSSRNSLQIEMFLSRLSSRFVGTTLIRDAIEESLAEIGQLTDACRVFFAIWRPDQDGFEDSIIWQAKCSTDLSDVIARYPEGLRRWYQSVFKTLEIMELDDLANALPTDVTAALLDAGDRLEGSLLMVPLVTDESLSGVVGLRYEHPDQTPSSSAWIVLDIFAHILERVIQLKRSEEALLATNRELKEKSAQLVQSEKMASIGQMAAGVAHEINNPVGFVMSNLGTLRDYTASLKAAIGVCRTLDADAHGLSADVLADLEFLEGDLDDLLDESLEGCERVRDIVQNMKGFARIDDSVVRSVDLNECVESTLKIVWNELKYRCNVVKNFGDLPALACYVGKINQVIMNLLVNAAQAIAQKGTITIGTRVEGEHIVLTIADTGCGIPADKLDKIFDPFYTTKDPGKGTGLGLYICHSIVEEHGGTIDAASRVGEGTTFTLRLPLAGVGDDREDSLD